jgi:mycothiol synthase
MRDPDSDPTRPWVSVSATLDGRQLAAVQRLIDEATDADGVRPLSEHVALHLREGGEGPDRHLLAVSDGRVVGYAHLDPTDVVAGAVAEVVVHPDWRGHGIGRALVLAADAAAPDDRLRLWAHGGHPAALGLAASLGFEQGRRLEQWRRSLFSPLPPVEVPEGFTLRSFVPGQDEAAWLRVNARAFADHPEQGSWTATDLQARLAESWFDPEGFLLVETDEDHTLVGFHWTKVHGGVIHRPHDQPAHAHEPMGEVYVVGIDPDWQGHHLGRTITLAGLHRLRALGLSQAMLYVDGDNVAAQRVYRALGFTPWDADLMFRRPRPS